MTSAETTSPHAMSPMSESQLAEFQAAPAPKSVRLIDFEQADIVTLESFPPRYVLRVSGTKPYLNMRVTLKPLTYVQRPD